MLGFTMLVKHWERKMHTFHFSWEECMIASEDITLQLSFPIDGQLMIGNYVVERNIYQICQMFLGMVPESKYTKGLHLKLT
uniref:Aminotransferase-like plant mobile domain-containing protein n=1 Tax=Gossypium raimondii TaxID=29730 RepID=A0A0D2P3A1_GOSRA|nr:hypothetical protein B456_007G052000 [Gossypium raimondii]KJB40222.1 hypothetical protein B456_007G052000 [Gossypium raimondii]